MHPKDHLGLGIDDGDTRAVLRLVWPSILLQSACSRVATAAAMERHVRKTA